MQNIPKKPDHKLIAGAFLAIAAIRGYTYYRSSSHDDLFFLAGFILLAIAAYKGEFIEPFQSSGQPSNRLFALASYLGVGLVAAGLIAMFAF